MSELLGAATPLLLNGAVGLKKLVPPLVCTKAQPLVLLRLACTVPVSVTKAPLTVLVPVLAAVQSIHLTGTLSSEPLAFSRLRVRATST